MREFVVMQEKAAGNASVGEEWIDTAIFPETATLADIAAWTWGAPNIEDTRETIKGGRVMIQIAQRPLEKDSG